MLLHLCQTFFVFFCIITLSVIHRVKHVNSTGIYFYYLIKHTKCIHSSFILIAVIMEHVPMSLRHITVSVCVIVCYSVCMCVCFCVIHTHCCVHKSERNREFLH